MRTARIERNTRETRITVEIDLDGSGRHEVSTGIPFLNHMMEIFARHSLIDLKITATGDLDVDDHHTVEDLGIVLGTCIDQALGDRKGIRRYGFMLLPMDESPSTSAGAPSGSTTSTTSARSSRPSTCASSRSSSAR